MDKVVAFSMTSQYVKQISLSLYYIYIATCNCLIPPLAHTYPEDFSGFGGNTRGFPLTLAILHDLERCTWASLAGVCLDSLCESPSSAERFRPRSLAWKRKQQNCKQPASEEPRMSLQQLRTPSVGNPSMTCPKTAYKNIYIIQAIHKMAKNIWDIQFFKIVLPTFIGNSLCVPSLLHHFLPSQPRDQILNSPSQINTLLQL